MPSLVQDPIASLRPYPIVVSVANRDFEIPALPAADWLAILMESPLDPEAIFPGLASEDAYEFVDDALYEGTLTMDELAEIVLDTIATASGRRWYVTIRLMGVAVGNWDVLGAELGLRGVDATKMSLAAWLDVFFLIVLRAMDPDKVTMFNLKLEAPPEGVPGVDEQPELEMDAATFMSMA